MLSRNAARWRGGFFRRVFTRLGLLLLAGMMGVGLISWSIVQQRLHDYAVEQLHNQAALAVLALEGRWPPRSDEALQDIAQLVRRQTGLRMTIIDPAGKVLGDSDADPATMANHADRPEVIAAIEGEIGQHERVSASVGQPFAYAAAPLKQNGRVVAVVRVAAPVADIHRREVVMAQWIVAGLMLALPLALVIAWFTARTLSAPIQRVSAWAQQLSTGDLATRLEVDEDDEVGRVAFSLERMRKKLTDRIKEVQQQRQDLAITVSSLEEGVIAVDRKGIVLVVNAAATRLLGVGHSLVGGPLGQLLTHRGLRRLWEDSLAASTRELRGEVVLGSGQEQRTVDVSILHIGDSGTPIARVVSLRDMTAIAKSIAIKTDFVANASHELRTPVASIRAAADTLGEDGLDPESRTRFLSVIDRNLRRLQDLTEALMHLNKVESPSVELNCVEVRPAEMFAGLRAIIAESLGQKRIDFRHVAEVEVLEADPSWLELALKNLLDNAVKFVNPGGRIELRCRPDGGRIVFEVEDTGCGIPSEDLDRVFERFYQVDKSRGMNTGGTGLGLAIVKHAVRAMGGEVTIDSTVGVGTTVSFWILKEPAREAASERSMVA